VSLLPSLLARSSSTSARIRILLADDHTVVRMGLAAVLSLDPALEIVAEAEDGLGMLQQYRLTRPDVVLLDLRMPEMDGVAALQRLRTEFPEARVLILTTSELIEDMRQTRAAGACGYLRKNVPRDQLISAIREVHAGRQLVNTEIDRRLAENATRRQLTARELEVLDYLRRGMTNRDIGVALEISEHTAKTHVKAILHKLQAADRAEAVANAFELGVLRVD
jgi:DNA-binding NarL/FixJ family response regulator